MLLRQIKYFQSVARCGSFTEAAEECYISQSAVSQQIRALEQELGVRLIDREKRRISLTPAGEFFYKRSLALTAELEKLFRDTAELSHSREAELRIGYLRSYGGQELQLAVAAFSAKHPAVSVQVISGNHEELYDLVRLGGADLVLNDQRRAFSDEYVNFELMTTDCYVELAGHGKFAAQKSVEISQLKDMPCILVTSKEQQENEAAYYRDVVGFKGDFLFAENMEDARLLVLGGKGVMPLEGGEHSTRLGGALCRVPLRRSGKPIHRKYCAFWRADSKSAYAEEFADLLKAQFETE